MKKTKVLVIVLTLVLLALPCAAKNYLIPLETVSNVTIAEDDDSVNVDWDISVSSAADPSKYSVELYGTVAYSFGTYEGCTAGTVDIELAYGTSDREDGGEMYDTYLDIPTEDVRADIEAYLLAYLGLACFEQLDTYSFDAYARVKPLLPGTASSSGKQNYPFVSSDPDYEEIVPETPAP